MGRLSDFRLGQDLLDVREILGVSNASKTEQVRELRTSVRFEQNSKQSSRIEINTGDGFKPFAILNESINHFDTALGNRISQVFVLAAR